MARSKKLGRYLEWHGNRIRVVVRVPPSLTAAVGTTKLRRVLTTTDPLEADREKVDVVRGLKAMLQDWRVGPVGDRAAEALLWREAVAADEFDYDDDEVTIGEALDDRVTAIEARHGRAAAQEFASIATGSRTPLHLPLDAWFAEKAGFSVGYREDIRRAVGRLEDWCKGTKREAAVEVITRRLAGAYIADRFVDTSTNPKVANKDISCLQSYWRWLERRYGVKENPWSNQRLEVRKRSRVAEASDVKRPYTDDEALVLLNGIRQRREWEFSMLSALSGLRLEEIASLRVKDVAAGILSVRKAKTAAGVRKVPMHPAITGIVESRTAGKPQEAYLFDDLGQQREGSKRERSAPVSQAFTRERRRLGVDERAGGGQRQSNVDFHSWRRFFIRRAVEALEGSARGFTAWTIANVVGHEVEGGKVDGMALPLSMTMGRYPGPASMEAMRACVEAVQLPAGVRIDRDDFAGRRVRTMRGAANPKPTRGPLASKRNSG